MIGTNFEWAVGELRKAIEAGLYGNVTFNLQEGIVNGSKVETFSKPKPPVDNKTPKP